MGTPGTSTSPPLMMSATSTKLTSTLTRSSLLRLPELSSQSSLRELSGPRKRSMRTPMRSPITEQRSARTTGRPAPMLPTSVSSKKTSKILRTASGDSREKRGLTGMSLSSTAIPRLMFSISWTNARVFSWTELDLQTELIGPWTTDLTTQSHNTVHTTTELNELYQSNRVSSTEFTLILYANVPAAGTVAS